MKKKRKLGIILACFGAFIIIICIAIETAIRREDKALDEQNKKYENMEIKTKSGEIIEMQYAYIDNNKFYFKVPKDFRELTYDEISSKYSGNVPNVVFSNEDTTINIAVSLTDNNMRDAEIESYKKYITNILEKNSDIINSDLYKVDKHTTGKIEFISDASDTKIYNNMIFFSYNDKLVILTFNSTLDLKEEWENIGGEVINSLFFKD